MKSSQRQERLPAVWFAADRGRNIRERRRVCVGRNVFTNKKSDEALNGDLGGLLQIETF